MKTINTLTAIALALALPAAAAQDGEGRDEYRPLFSETRIQNASPDAKQRMIEAERQNRAAFERRQQQRGVSEQRGDDEQPAAPQELPARTTARHARSKIFRWVDSSGRVTFSDVPRGANATEVKVRINEPAAGAGAPAPAPRGDESD